jgi:hypothetical protein
MLDRENVGVSCLVVTGKCCALSRYEVDTRGSVVGEAR